ncbi:hypothetical protein [Campylobacter phage CJLB-10]|nr:hypothetical protein [Campylobacter phage CJLB-7]QXO06056.1 hypothetical protein [Campylobacter phage CJLB-10]
MVSNLILCVFTQKLPKLPFGIGIKPILSQYNRINTIKTSLKNLNCV